MDTIKKVVKIDDNTISVIKETAMVEAKDLPPVIYEYGFLLKQKDDIQKQWDEQLKTINDARQAEMDEVDALIAEADKLQVVAKVIEPIIKTN